MYSQIFRLDLSFLIRSGFIVFKSDAIAI